MDNYKLTIGQIISKAFSNVKNSITALLPVLLFFILPSTLLDFLKTEETIIQSDSFNNIDGVSSFIKYSTESNIFSGLNFLIFIVTSFIGIYASAVAIKILYDQYTLGSSNFKEAFSYCTERLGKIVLLNLLIYAIVFLGAIGFILFVIIFSILTLGIGLFLIIPIMLFLLFVLFPLGEAYISTMIIKDLGVMESFSETNKLFKKGSFWKSTGRFLAIGSLAFLLYLVLSILTIIPFIGAIIIGLLGFLILNYVHSANNILVIQELKEETPPEYEYYDNL